MTRLLGLSPYFIPGAKKCPKYVWYILKIIYVWQIVLKTYHGYRKITQNKLILFKVIKNPKIMRFLMIKTPLIGKFWSIFANLKTKATLVTVCDSQRYASSNQLKHYPIHLHKLIIRLKKEKATCLRHYFLKMIFCLNFKLKDRI